MRLTRHVCAPESERCAMEWQLWLAGVTAALLLVYLVMTLLYPERF